MPLLLWLSVDIAQLDATLTARGIGVYLPTASGCEFLLLTAPKVGTPFEMAKVCFAILLFLTRGATSHFSRNKFPETQPPTDTDYSSVLRGAGCGGSAE